MKQLVIMGIALSLGCMGKRTISNEAAEGEAPEGEVSRGQVMSRPTFQAILFIEWGMDDAQLEPAYTELTQAGLQVSAPMRKRFRPVDMRVDEDGRFHFLDSARAIVRYDAASGFEGRTSLARSGTADVIDFAAGRGHYYLLLGGPGQTVTLACMDHAGAEVWARPDIENDMVKPDRVILARNRLIIASAADTTRMVELSVKDGSTVERHQVGQGGIRWFAAPDGMLVSTTFFRKERRRGVVLYDPASKRESAAMAGKELFGPLLSVFGTDAAYNVHVYGTALNSSSPGLFRVSPRGQLLHEESLGWMLVDPEKRIFVVNMERMSVRLRVAGEEDREATIPLPDTLAPHAPSRMDLVGAGLDELIFDLHDPSGQIHQRVALHLSTEAVSEVAVGAGAVIPGQQSARTWQVGADGSVYVPVASAEGLGIVRINW
jgi:hypothetical protein